MKGKENGPGTPAPAGAVLLPFFSSSLLPFPSAQQPLRLRRGRRVVVAGRGGRVWGGQAGLHAAALHVAALAGVRLADRPLGLAHVALELLDPLAERARDLGN